MTIQRCGVLLALALGLALAGGGVSAQDEGLYEAPVDPNSAFVRVLSPGAAAAVVNGTSFNDMTDGLSPYINVQPGEIALSAAGNSGTLSASAGAYYTYAWDATGGAVILEDKVSNDPAKADVYLYNLTDKPAIDLFVPAAKVKAIQAAPADGSKSVALKAPLTIDIDVVTGGEKIGEVKNVALTRRGGVSIVASGSKGSYQVVAIKNMFVR
jgi:alginate O-acetyltransferase complex protein AlgF